MIVVLFSSYLLLLVSNHNLFIPPAVSTTVFMFSFKMLRSSVEYGYLSKRDVVAAVALCLL